MTKPSVLFINRVYPPVSGATGRLLRDLARAFAREGWEVTVITTGRRPLKERDGGVRVIRVKGAERPRGIFSYLSVWIRLFFVARRFSRTDLIVTMTDPPLLILLGRILSKSKKSRHIHWCHDLYPDIFPSVGFRFPDFLMEMMKKITRRAMRDCDRVVVIGRCMARHLTYGGLDARRISVVPNWPDFELVKPPGADGFNGISGAPQPALPYAHISVSGAKAAHEQIRDESPKFRVLYAGNLGRAHPLSTILNAARILEKDHPEIEFVFVGEGPRFDEIARERGKRGLHNIRLLPYQPQSKLKHIMESGDVHLISMRDDALGLLVPSKLYAALAVGRPCIFVGPGDSETATVINDFRAGSVIAQGDAAALAGKILDYRMNGEEWFAAHSGAAAAGQIFTPSESIKAWIERAAGVLEPQKSEVDL